LKKISLHNLTPLHIIHLCSAIGGILIFGVALTGLIVEAPELWREGPGTFFTDTAVRLVFGALVALLTATPYLLLAVAARRSGPPMLFAVVSIFMFGLHLWLSIQALFFARSSTASIGLLFIPIYLLAFAIATWVVVSIMRKVMLNRAPK
jgi:hypothetical protein